MMDGAVEWVGPGARFADDATPVPFACGVHAERILRV
jgi:hypothetical protein